MSPDGKARRPYRPGLSTLSPGGRRTPSTSIPAMRFTSCRHGRPAGAVVLFCRAANTTTVTPAHRQADEQWSKKPASRNGNRGVNRLPLDVSRLPRGSIRLAEVGTRHQSVFDQRKGSARKKSTSSVPFPRFLEGKSEQLTKTLIVSITNQNPQLARWQVVAVRFQKREGRSSTLRHCD